MPVDSEVPPRFGRYEIVRYLGGGMSRVYEARDTVLNRSVALKLLADDMALDNEARTRFLREARFASGVESDHVVKIYDFGEMNGHLFLVSELLRGSDLRAVLREGTLNSVSENLKVLLQVADGLAAIHQHGIVHRDIKPDNIHIERNGRVRLMDFGVARSEDLNLTRTGVTMGTPYYMAPEQILAERVDCRTDLYSFGIVAFEMLAGHRPVVGDTVAALFHKTLHEPLDLQPLENAKCPRALIALIASCSAKQIEDRPKSAEEVATKLRAILNDAATVSIDTAATTATRKFQPTSGTLLVIALVAVAVVLVMGALLLNPRKAGGPVTKNHAEQAKASEAPTQRQTTGQISSNKRVSETTGRENKQSGTSAQKQKSTNPFQDESVPPPPGPFVEH